MYTLFINDRNMNNIDIFERYFMHKIYSLENKDLKQCIAMNNKY